MVILEPSELGSRIPRGDRRWEHLRKVLRKVPGDRVSAGVADGPVGTATVVELDGEGMLLDFEPEAESPALAPVTLVLGFPRPIQAARILRDLATLGLSSIRLVGTQLGEKSYTQSDFFARRDFRRPLLEGAEQAGNPRLPAVETHWTLALCLEALRDGIAAAPTRILLHPYGAQPDLGSLPSAEAPAFLAVGPERGWADAELADLGAAGFASFGLGRRILRTETAALAAACILLSRMGLM